MRFVQKQANDINVHYRSNSVKIIEFSDKLKKPCFWPILGRFFQFWGQKQVSWKITHNFMWVSSTMPKSRKS